MTGYARIEQRASAAGHTQGKILFDEPETDAVAGTIGPEFSQEYAESAPATASSAHVENMQKSTEVELNVTEVIRKTCARFDPLYIELENIAMESIHWAREGEPPSDGAIDDARALLARLQAVSFAPARVVASADGGVGMFFRSGKKYADFECANNGRISAVVSNGEGDVRAFPVDPSFEGENKAIAEIRAFLEN